MKIEYFCIEDVKYIFGILKIEKYFIINLLKNKF